MGYMKFTLKNLKRQPIRTSLTIIGIAIAVAVLVSLVGFNKGYKQSLENDIKKMGYEVLVMAKGCPYEAATLMLTGGEIPAYVDTDVYNRVVSIKEIQDVTPIFIQASYVDKGKMQLFTGIEKSYLTMKPWMKFQDKSLWFSSPDAEEVILGYEVAEALTRRIGDELWLGGNINRGFKVVGIFERSGTQDDGTIFLNLKRAQKLFKKDNKLTAIGIKLKDITRYSNFVDAVNSKVPEVQVVTVAQIKGTIIQLLQTANMLIISVAIIAIFVAAIGVLNTILMSVMERTSEIGIMKAMGASSLQVFRFVWIETIFLCLIGGAFGALLAYGASSVVELILRSILSFTPSGSIVIISPEIILYSLIGAVTLGIISGLYPAFRASQMDPIQAIYSL